MVGSPSDDSRVGGSSNGISSGQRCQYGEALTEWRSSEQVENGTPSTSPPYWDTYDEDDGCGPKPSELYGKFTWKIENFSQISKRELWSNAFEVKVPFSSIRPVKLDDPPFDSFLIHTLMIHFEPRKQDANKKGLSKISEEVKYLAGKARSNTLKPEEFEGGTFTVLNL